MSAFLPPIVVELRAKAGEFKHEMASARKEISKTGDETERSSGRMGKAFRGAAGMGKVFALGAIGAGIAIAGFSVEAAVAAQNAESNLDTALKNAGSSFEALHGPIEDADAQMRKFGYTNQDTNQALANMTVALGSPKKALDDLGLASDLARLKNISLAQAGILVAKAAEGNLKPLKALGIDLPIAAGGAKVLANAQSVLNGVTQKAKTFLEGHRDALQKSSKFHLTYMQMLDKVHAAQAKVNAAQSAGGNILAALKAKVGGTAAAYGDTLSGKIAAAHAQIEQLGETLGNKLIPIITAAIGIGTKWALALSNNKPALIAIGAVIGVVVVGAITAYIASLVMAAARSLTSFGKMIASVVKWAAAHGSAIAKVIAQGAVWLAQTIARTAVTVASWAAQTAATVAATVATGAMTAAQWLLNAALSANPVALVVIAVVALIGIFVLAYAKLSWFRNGVNAIFHAIGAVVSGTVNFIKSHWQLVLAILTGPVGIALLWVKNNWSKVTGIFQTVVGGIKTALSKVFSIITWPFRTAFNAVADLWNNTLGAISFTVPSWIPVIGGKGFSFPHMPHLAAGGHLLRGGLVTLGERGAEVVRLPAGSDVFPHGSAPSGGARAVHVHLHFNGPVLGTVRDFVREVVPAIQTEVLRQNNRNGFNILSGAAT